MSRIVLSLLFLTISSFTFAADEEGAADTAPSTATTASSSNRNLAKPTPAGKASDLLKQGIVKKPDENYQGSVVSTSICKTADGKTLSAGEKGFDDCMLAARNSLQKAQNGYIYQNSPSVDPKTGAKRTDITKPLPSSGAQPGVGFQYKLK